MDIVKKKPQWETLLEQFERGKTVSQLEAIVDLGIGHISSVVSNMILKYEIPVRKVTLTSRSGARYMGYYMDKVEAREHLARMKAIFGKKEK